MSQSCNISFKHMYSHLTFVVTSPSIGQPSYLTTELKTQCWKVPQNDCFADQNDMQIQVLKSGK